MIKMKRSGCGSIGYQDKGQLNHRIKEYKITPHQFIMLNNMNGIKLSAEKRAHFDKVSNDPGVGLGTFYLCVEREPGGWRVTGHEGRHRALYLIENGLGNEYFPCDVEFKIDGHYVRIPYLEGDFDQILVWNTETVTHIFSTILTETDSPAEVAPNPWKYILQEA